MARATGRKRDRSESRLRAQMEDLGIDGEELSGKRQARSVTEGSRVREAKAKRQRLISASAGSRVRSSSRVPRDQSGLRDEKMVEKTKKMRKRAQNRMNHQAKKGEADRKILNMKPKHLFAGKRTVGKTDRR
ncbi:GTP-binding protein 4-like [Paramacrobiotus metropolitanus]|uniref:GTP-binding protein 4-like n=1 Tax=Paramacrobiotus metropolitanus TaxID=2943436 RepID=UPI0024459696|nr:GTP-binding protein 4-like [Paramacrobiotus metropolitanus]